MCIRDRCDPDVCLTFFQYLVSYASGKPVIGISWGCLLYTSRCV